MAKDSPKTLEDLRAHVAEQQRQEPTALTAGRASLADTMPGPAPHPQGQASGAGRAFDAAEFSDLDFSLKPYADVSGTVPYPTRERLSKFSKRITKILSDSGEIAELLATADERYIREHPEIVDDLLEQAEKASQEQRDAVAYLCNGTPSKAVLNKLPDPIFRRFYGWLMGELNPEV